MTTPPTLGEKPRLPLRPPRERDGRPPQPPDLWPTAPAHTAQHDDTAVHRLLDSLCRRYEPMVTRIAARTPRSADRDPVAGIAQDVWLDTWQYLLRGNLLHFSAGSLVMRDRFRAVDYYRLDRVRCESSTDFIDALALRRLTQMIGAAE